MQTPMSTLKALLTENWLREPLHLTAAATDTTEFPVWNFGHSLLLLCSLSFKFICTPSYVGSNKRERKMQRGNQGNISWKTKWLCQSMWFLGMRRHIRHNLLLPGKLRYLAQSFGCESTAYSNFYCDFIKLV